VVTVNCFHNGAGDFGIYLGILLDITQEMLLQCNFICSVIDQICGKGIVMSICKGIGDIVDQLAESIVIIYVQMLFVFETPGDAAHKTSGIAVVMSPEPLAADGTLQVGSGISVRFYTAYKKCFLMQL